LPLSGRVLQPQIRSVWSAPHPHTQVYHILAYSAANAPRSELIRACPSVSRVVPHTRRTVCTIYSPRTLTANIKAGKAPIVHRVNRLAASQSTQKRRGHVHRLRGSGRGGGAGLRDVACVEIEESKNVSCWLSSSSVQLGPCPLIEVGRKLTLFWKRNAVGRRSSVTAQGVALTVLVSRAKGSLETH
jgi:hypothetical protein